MLAVLLGILSALVAGFTLGNVAIGLAAPVIARFDVVSMGPFVLDTPREALPVALVFAPLWCVVSAYARHAARRRPGGAGPVPARSAGGRAARTGRELRRSRLDLVDAFETERKRIERHLHDGVQQRLVGLTMTLGLAELELPDGEGRRLVHKAHREAEAALADLREAVRGIHPRVLVDHGLAAAVREIADRSPVPVEVAIALPSRLPAPVEAAAYFVVSEGLANVAKHAAALDLCGPRLGPGRPAAGHRDRRRVGGAAVGAGSGLTGLVTRLDALVAR